MYEAYKAGKWGFVSDYAELDIVYNDKNALVQEYIALLKQRLKTNNFNLVLMTNVEIEKCIIDKEEEIYAYLSDEIYEHFKNNGNEYPVEAVGLHIDIIMALVYLSEKEKVYNYLHTIKEIYKETFGDKNYLFCRNWGYILNEVLLELIPEVAIEEFDENLNLFASVLREDIILYRLCINIAARKTNQDKDIGYIKESIELCKIWCDDIPAEKQKGIRSGSASDSFFVAFSLFLFLYCSFSFLPVPKHTAFSIHRRLSGQRLIKHDHQRHRHNAENDGHHIDDTGVLGVPVIDLRKLRHHGCRRR